MAEGENSDYFIYLKKSIQQYNEETVSKENSPHTNKRRRNDFSWN